MTASISVNVQTFGCKVNTYDSGLLQKNLLSAGFSIERAQGKVAVHILNTCAVTAEATKQAIREIRRLKAANPLAKIVVTGCSAQVDTGAFDQLPSVDLVVANSHKGLLPELLEKHLKGQLTDRVFKSNIFHKEDPESGGGLEEGHSRSFLKIQDGCNSFCSFCIIPYARGKSRSISVSELVRRVQELEFQGLREVVLTGVHIGDYEDATTGARLESLIESLLKATHRVRFRLTSLEPIEVSDALLDLYADSRMCPHFHMSIQSASTKVLRDMKRKYGRAEVEDCFAKIQRRVPGAFVGMDVIAGFPTESEEDFEETYASLTNSDWCRIHVFPYSERKGTKAAVMVDTVPWSERKHRASLLRQLSLQRYQQKANAQLGMIKAGLPLLRGPRNSSQSGSGAPAQETLSFLTHDYWNVKVPVSGDQLPMGEYEIRLKEYRPAFGPQNPEGEIWGELLSVGAGL